MKRAESLDVTGRRSALVMCTLAIVAAVLAMHTAGASARSTTLVPGHTAMHPAGLHGAATHPAAVGQLPHAACAHEHCVATLPASPRLSAPAGSVVASEAPRKSSPVAVRLRPANPRAPPRAVCVIDICVSRT